MKEFTIGLSDDTFKKVRALNVLLGGGIDIDDLLVRLVDKALTDALLTELGLDSSAPAPGRIIVQAAARQAAVHQLAPATDVSGISDGLGDHDYEDGAPAPAPAPKQQRAESRPGAASLTDADIESDMHVEDPDHEAAVDGQTFADQMSPDKTAETIFADMADLPVPPELPPSTRRRRSLTGTKAKVSSATGAN